MSMESAERKVIGSSLDPCAALINAVFFLSQVNKNDSSRGGN